MAKDATNTPGTTIEGNLLVIRLPMYSPPQPSTSGKSLKVASTGGFQATTAIVDGKPVRISVNAIIEK